MKISLGDSAGLPDILQRSTRIIFRTGVFQLKWQHCSTSADFLSHFYDKIFTSEEHPGGVHELTHAIAYMANELIENAVKFRADGDVIIESGLSEESFLFRIQHSITPEISEQFQALLRKITEGDPGELLIEQLEANAEDENATGSGLGLLTLMNDYGARISWSFEPSEDQPEKSVLVDTVARLALPR